MRINCIRSNKRYETMRINGNNYMGIRSEPSGSDSKASACNAGDLGSVLELGRFPGEWNGYPLQCSCLENSTDRGAWWATPWGHKESDMTE